MARWQWIAIGAAIALMVGVIILNDRGSFAHAMLTGACNSDHPPSVCHTRGRGRRFGG